MIVSFSPLFSIFSHQLRHEIAHLFCCTFLHLPRDVGVGSQCESCVEMAKHTGHCFHVYAVLECYARIHTAEIQRIADYGISQGKEQLNDL